MIFFDLLYILILLLTLPFWAKYLFKKEYRALLKHRLSPDISPNNKKRIWLHAVSVGEVRSLKNLVAQLKQQFKSNGHEMEIVLTVTTPAGYSFAKQQYKNLSVINAPVDFTFTIKKFIKKINPQLLILNELEIWPNWILTVKRKQIPILLINGRISDNAFKRYKRSQFLLKIFFNKIDRFLVQTATYKERFQHLNIPAEKIAVCGNIKADEAFKALELLPPDEEIFKTLGIPEPAEPAAPVPDKKHKKIVTVASSHLDDEQLLAPIINQSVGDFFFIIVPRHLTRVTEIGKLLEKHGVDFTTWSKRDPNKPIYKNVLIFDRMGYLFNVLKITDIVFMGGTLDAKIGGHNLYEPAVLGKLTVGGPCFNNFPDIGGELTDKGVYHVVNTSEELARFLEKSGQIDGETVKRNAAAAVSGRKGSIQFILKEIQPFIK
ncbi:MAG: hypothetical protein GY950_30845 [bacterium]|nr:hypothetical protein [bacterium]